MFAVVRTGGKQYRVAAGDKIVVDRMAGEAGDVIRLGDVLFAGGNGSVGDAGSLLVSAQIIAQAKADKVIVFKKKRRHNYRRKNGHRQQHTILRITAVGDDNYVPGEKRSASVSDNDLETQPDAALPTANLTEPAATEPQVQEPLKVETSESPMVDTPASDTAADQSKA